MDAIRARWAREDERKAFAQLVRKLFSILIAEPLRLSSNAIRSGRHAIERLSSLRWSAAMAKTRRRTLHLKM